MAKPAVKFMSYNSTGLSPAKTKWISELMDTCKVDFCGIQEHFKQSRSLVNHFKKVFPKFDAHVEPAHREEGRDTGRAKGGLAQLTTKDLQVKRGKVATSTWRVQAQILHFSSYKLLWMNVYFPCDPKVINFDDSELLQVQLAVEEILEAGGYDDCICGGDWNYDERRTSGYAVSMQQFLARVGLVSVWERYAVDFTHLHTDNKSTSILDNFYMNERLLQYVDDAAPMHLGDNLSRHSPIMLSLRISDIPLGSCEQEETMRRPRRLAWDSADQQQVKQYQANLQKGLEDLEVPTSLTCTNVKCTLTSHSTERDDFVLDVMSKVLEAGHSSIPLKPAPKKPSKGSNSHAQLPGWNEKVKPLKSDAKFWYAIWLSAGRPNKGTLHSIMVNTKVKYRSAVRKAQGEANTESACALLAAAESGNRALMGQMRKAMGSRKAAQDIPPCLEGAEGDAEVVEKFRDLYNELYNSCSTEAEVEVLLADLMSKIDCRAEGEVSKLTAAVVKRACSRMNPGRKDVSESYSSDVFKHGPELLNEHLAIIFRSFLVHGTMPLSILACAFMPLLKGRKNPVKFDSYRAVAMASQLLKVFEYCILEVWGSCLESDSLQFGYKSGTGADQCSWLLLTTAEYFVQRGSPTLCCLLDVSKGFDRVKFSTLFDTLLKKGLPAIVVRILIFSYTEQSGVVQVAGRRSSTFGLSNGTRQGAVASPALWAVYVDDLLLELRSKGLGCFVAGVWMGAVLYVDDLALLAPTRKVLAEMLAVVEKYSCSHNLNFSVDSNPKLSKTKCIFFGNHRSRTLPAPLTLYGKELPWVENAMHLGHQLHSSLSMDQDVKKRRAAFIARSVEVREQFSFAPPLQRLRAVQLLCCDAYGSPLWRLNSNQATSFFKAWSSCVRRAFNLPVNTFTYIVEGHLAQRFTPLRNQVLGRYPGFYRRLLESPSKEVRMMAVFAAGQAQTVTAVNLAHLRALTGLDPAWDSIRQIKESLPVKTVPAGEQWRLGLLDSLLALRAEKQAEEEDVKRIVALLSSLCST